MASPHAPPSSTPLGAQRRSTLATAFALALAAAVSLGLARFSYALLLPPMRSDLGWSYLTSGSMNTVNAAGYLAGALAMPLFLRRVGARRALLAGGLGAGALLIAHGLVTGDLALYALRLLTGVASAATFVAGGLLAARLASQGAPSASGLVLGIYYGGTGVGIVLSALLVPPLSGRAVPHAWQAAWMALGAAALVATALTAWATRDIDAHTAAPALRARFVVTLLREQQLGDGLITVFYALLGVAVIGSSWWWAGLLQRQRGGGAMRLLNALLAVATVLPVLSAHPIAVFASGLLFGAVFLSVVASTTALVRHNAPAAAWPAGISAFTIVFAAGQIVGPTLVGWVADGAGGLRGGLACSAAVLLLGALVAWGQRPLDAPTHDAVNRPA
jgi:predicted MFS family arabinose efflux permease